MKQYLDRQVELRNRAWEEAKSLLDHAATESRDLSGEEQAQYDRIVGDIDRYDESIQRFRADADREQRASEARIDIPVAPQQATVESDNDVLRSLLTGERRNHTFENRATATPMSTSADAELVPQGFYAVIQEILRYTGPAFQPGLYTILNTASGNDIKVPRQTAFSAATATAEGAQFAVSNPTGESFTLKAQKVGVLLKTSREIIEDSGIDLVSYIARQAGEAVGYKVNDLLATGTGGGTQPNGIFVAAGSGVTGGTAVGGAFTADNLIDLLHSVDSAVAARPATALQMNRATLGAVRKLKDGDGRYLFEYGAAGEPRILGERIVENPFAPAIGTSNKSVIYGDMSSYHVRQVGGIEVARSDDFAFDTDEVVWRVAIRIWGDLGQSANVKHFIGNAA
jgi:HK97 family phage major capsid protein